jgi:5-methylcytosine-specific restriction protein A
MPPRRCQHCWQLVAAGTRCPCSPHTRTGYDSAERRRRAQTVADHLEAYGSVCPGWHREMHEVDERDLTADHVRPVAAGGDPRGPLEVLCRSCNSRKGARTH